MTEALAETKQSKRDAREVSDKIEVALKKLAGMFRKRAEAAARRLKTAKDDEKRARHRRRFELYSNAATDLDEQQRSLRSRFRSNN